MEFRLLTPREIDCRVQQIRDTGVSLLLYKDARCDMAILDQTVGAENWQRKHQLINGNLFCDVGVRVGGEWIWKQDVGTESNTEKEKGQASDSFKRACVNWGIGRELYSAPFIWVDKAHAGITEKNGRQYCNTKFIVTDIQYDDAREITGLTIANAKTGEIVYTYGANKQAVQMPVKAPKMPAAEPPEGKGNECICIRCGNAVKAISVNGRAYSVEKIVANAQKKYGDVYCAACQSELSGNG